MISNIKWGIIGCGDVTEVKSGPAFNRVNNSSLVAVMRRNGNKAGDYARRHNVPKWYDDAQKLIDDEDVNAIYIATPPLYHNEYALAALKAGKPVYVEKPMAVTMDAAKKMAAYSDEVGVKLSVAHYRRRLPLFLKIKELLQDGLIGEPRFIRMEMLQPHNAPLITQTEDNWRINPSISGGGLFHDLAPHQLDLMLYFFGEVEKGAGVSGNQGGYYEADDIVQGQLMFNNGIIFSGTWCFTVPKEETSDKCEIIGSRGKMRFSIFKHDQLIIEANQQTTTLSFDVPNHIQQPMIEQVVQYFLDEGDNPCSAHDGVEVMRLMELFTTK